MSAASVKQMIRRSSLPATAELRTMAASLERLAGEVDRLLKSPEADPGSECYVLSIKWSRGGDNLVWWGPNNSGYTTVLDRAGRYTREEILGHESYYNDGADTLAVPCAVVDALAVRVVPDDAAQRLAIKKAVIAKSGGSA